jgi:sulfate transport system permease protein
VALPLQVGFVTSFLLIVVVLPIAAVIWRSTGNGWSGFWEVVSSPQAVSALKLTVIMSTLAVLTTAVFGTIIAWVLVRDSFAGKSVVNAIIDLPFALPTIVAGLVIMALYGPRTPIDFTIGSHHFDANVTFTRGAIYVALLFVTLPFVVRTVQPVLIELDTELEDAARSLGASGFATFRRVVLPSILPGILSGVAMAFARAVGEIGAIVLIAGNLPFKTEVASIHLFHRIEQDPEGSAAVAVVLLLISFSVLLGIGAVRWYVTRHERG